MTKNPSVTNRVDPIKKILIVAGSDPTAGAGLQADLKTVIALGGYAMTAVTAVTVQDTRAVKKVKPLSGRLVVEQMTACLSDMGADAIKLGMLATAEIVEAVADLLEKYPHIPVIADPVLAGTGGGELLDGPGRTLFMERLLPRLYLITPNAPEAESLSGLTVSNRQEQEAAAIRLSRLGPAVLLTGGHLPGNPIIDLLVDSDKNRYEFSCERITGLRFHGTGCTLTSAIAVAIAQGLSLPQGVKSAQAYLGRALAGSLDLGQGQRLLHGEYQGKIDI